MTAPHPQCQPGSEHTPTPWRVFTTPDGRKLVGIGGLDGEGILDCGFGVWSWKDADGIANANLVVEAVNSHALLLAKVETLTRLLRSVSTQCGNVIYNCEQRPSDNDRHLSSWRSVKEFVDGALAMPLEHRK